MHEPLKTFKGPTCRSEWRRGRPACGHCENCAWETANSAATAGDAPVPVGDPSRPEPMRVGPYAYGWHPTAAAHAPVYQQMPRPTDGAFTIPYVQSHAGCICPPGANRDCEAPLCPRKNHLKAKE